MAGFKKAHAEQAAVKMSMYGPPGSGKTFSALLFAEGLAASTGKRIAFIDTERGTDFYATAVPDRNPHPEAFDFDALYTRSIAEVAKECRALKPEEYSVIVLDSISHLWETAINSFTGGKTKAGTIPMWAWAGIKKPYKDLMKWLIDCPFHVFILGRQGNVFEEDEDTGETKATGVKMKAEGETPYEPHICLRMIPERAAKQGKKIIVHKEQIITAFAEKDRTGVLAGKRIEWPNFQNVIAPILGIMGGVQGVTPSDDDAAAQDADELRRQEQAKSAESHQQRDQFLARFSQAGSREEVEAVSKQITAAVRRTLLPADLVLLREAYQKSLTKNLGLRYEPAAVANGVPE